MSLKIEQIGSDFDQDWSSTIDWYCGDTRAEVWSGQW